MAKLLKYKQNLNFFLNLIDSRIANEDYLGALDASRRAYASAHTNIDRVSLNLLIAEVYFYMELYELSCEYYFRAAQVPEVRASAYYGLGVCLIKLNKHKLAIEYFEVCSRSQSDTNFTPLINNCLNMLELNTSPQSTQLSERLLKTNPVEAINLLKNLTRKNIHTQILLANAHINNSQFDEARDILFEVLKLNPSNIEAIITLCELCKNQNDLPNLDTILSNLNTIPLSFSQYMQISSYYCVLEKWNDAIKNYLLAAEINPHNIEVEVYLSLCYLNINNKTEALYHIGKAKWIDIENPIVNAISDCLQKDTLVPPVKVAFTLPEKNCQEKIDNVVSALKNDFCKNIFTSPWLENDVNWCLATKINLTNHITNNLSKCKRKKLTQLYQNYLLTIKLNKNQKYFLIKNSIINKNLKILHFTTDFRLKSIKYSSPKVNNIVLQNAFINATAYCAVFDIVVNLKANFSTISSLQEANSLTENECSTLFFIDTPLFYNASIFFKTDIQKLLDLWGNFKGDFSEKE